MKKDAYFLSPGRQSRLRICSCFFLWRFSISVRLFDFLAFICVNWVSCSFTHVILWFFPKSWVIFAGFIFFAYFSFRWSSTSWSCWQYLPSALLVTCKFWMHWKHYLNAWNWTWLILYNFFLRDYQCFALDFSQSSWIFWLALIYFLCSWM